MPDLEATIIDFSKIKNVIDWDRLRLEHQLKILFVTDSRFTDTNSVYEVMNGARVGCTRYRVDRALYTHGGGAVVHNPSPGPNDPDWENFKFTSTRSTSGSTDVKILDDYHVIFIFAVSSSGSIPDSELVAIHDWMNAGGGVFATGDHDTLGERLCTKIPRVATMRKWSDADGVPPGGGLERIDTNQPVPSIAGHFDGSVTIPNSVQGDEFPQPIEWVPDRVIHKTIFQRVEYPHEVLCHPTLGVINVMPDHPHEGECVEPSAMTFPGKVEYDETNPNRPDEYPSHPVTSHMEEPKIIAYGRNTVPYSEHKLAKGEVNPKRFAMISVYDGHKSDVGRVAVDSTWHHWYGMNIDGLKSADNIHWKKIKRYFLNLPRYLAPAGVFREKCHFEIIEAFWKYPFIEEHTLVRTSDRLLDIGRSLRETLTLSWGPCGVVRFILINICDVKPWLCKLIEREYIDIRDPLGPHCLTCPPFDLIVDAAFGGIAEEFASIREEMKAAMIDGKSVKRRLDTEEIDKLIKSGTAKGVDQFFERVAKDLDKLSGDLKEGLSESRKRK